MATLAKAPLEQVCGWADKSVADKLVARAKELRPFLAEQAPEGEKRRSPTEAVDRMLKEEGFLQLIVPQRLGGFGLSPTDFSRVQMEIAKGDPAVSWVM